MISSLHAHTTFKMPTIKQTWQLIEQGYTILLSPLTLRMFTCIFLMWSIIIIFCNLFGKTNFINGLFCHLGLLHPLRFLLLLNPYCFFAVAKVFILSFILMISFSWVALSVQARAHNPFVLAISLSWVTCNFFKVWTSSHWVFLFFRFMLGYGWYVFISEIW